MLARSLMSAGGKVLVAAAAAAAMRHHDAFIRLLKVVDQLTGFSIVDHCADRNFQDDVFAVTARTVRAHAVLAALGLVLGVVTKVEQRVVALGGLHDDVAAAAAIAA